MSPFAFPACERPLQPLRVVATREVLAEMRAPAFGPLRGAVGDAERELEHLLHPVRGRELGVGACRLVAQADVPAALEQRLQLVDRGPELGTGAEDADLGRHHALHRRLDRRRILVAGGARDQAVELGLLGADELAHEPGRDANVVGVVVAEVGDEVADDHAGDHRLGNRVAAQPVEPMHVPAGGLAGGEQPLQRRALAGVVGADAAHRVVLRRPHGNHLLDRIDAEEGLADLLDLAQVLLDVRPAELRDVEPEVLAEARLRALALADVRLHAARDDVARRKLLLLGLVVGHEAMPVGVLEQPAVAAAAFGDEDAGGKDRGRMELHRFHVAERRDAGLERDRAADAFADHAVGRHPIEPSRPARGDDRRLRDVGAQLARGEVASDRPVAAAAFMDQRDRFHALVDGDRLGDRAVAHRVEHGVAGAVRDVAGAPLLRAAEVALGDQAVRLVALGEGDLLAVDDHLAVAAGDAAPRHAPRRELAHRLGRGVDEHPHDALVGAPVAAAHRVLEVHVLVVALPLDDVGERGLHAALRRRRVGALRRHQGQDDRVVAAPLRADRDAQAGETAADREHIGVDDLHRGAFISAPAARAVPMPACKARPRAARARCRS